MSRVVQLDPSGSTHVETSNTKVLGVNKHYHHVDVSDNAQAHLGDVHNHHYYHVQVNVVGTVSVITTIIDVASKSITTLADIRNRYKDANMLVSLLSTQLVSVRTALDQIRRLIEESLQDDQHYQLVMNLDIAIKGCQLLLEVLDEQISRLENKGDDPMIFKNRVKLTLESSVVEQCLTRLDRQMLALNTIITAYSARSPSRQKELMEEESSQRIFEQVRDDTTSLYVLYDSASFVTRRTQTTTATSKFSFNFKFDTELLQHRVYKAAFRSLLRKPGKDRRRAVMSDSDSPPHTGNEQGVFKAANVHSTYKSFYEQTTPDPHMSIMVERSFMVEKSGHPHTGETVTVENFDYPDEPNAQYGYTETLGTKGSVSNDDGRKPSSFDQDEDQGAHTAFSHQKNALAALESSDRTSRSTKMDRILQKNPENLETQIAVLARGKDAGSLFAQLGLLHDDEYSQKKCRACRQAVDSAFCAATEYLPIEHEINEGGDIFNNVYVQYRKQFRKSMFATIEQHGDLNPDLQENLSSCTKYLLSHPLLKGKLSDKDRYFLSNSMRIFTSGYVPSVQDIVEASSTTSGSEEMRFEMNHRNALIQHLRSNESAFKWLKPGPNFHDIIYAFDLTEYVQVADTGWSSNRRMRDSIAYFDHIVNSCIYKQTNVILVACNLDAFGKKLSNYPLGSYFSDYTEGSDIHKAADYILRRFTDVNRRGLNLQHYIWESSDTGKLREIFAVVKEDIVSSAYRDSGTTNERLRSNPWSNAATLAAAPSVRRSVGSTVALEGVV